MHIKVYVLLKQNNQHIYHIFGEAQTCGGVKLAHGIPITR
jgi:hypothetical protein